MALPSFAAGPRDDACWGEAPIFGRGGGQKTHQNNKLLCACGRETIQCHRGYGGQGPIPGIIVGGRDTTAGVAELADAQDLGFHVSAVSNLLTDARHYTRFISAAKGYILKRALSCSLLLIV